MTKRIVWATSGLAGILAACSSSSGGGSKPPPEADAGTPHDDAGSVHDAASEGSGSSRFSYLIVTDPNKDVFATYDPPGQTYVASGSEHEGVCNGSATFCKSLPSSVTFTIMTGAALPLTATLWNCPGVSAADCVPAMNEGAGDLNAVTVTFGAPNGNSGPMTTLVLEQVGSVVNSSCPNAVVANASHIKVEDSRGSYVLFPFLQGACCDTGCQ